MNNKEKELFWDRCITESELEFLLEGISVSTKIIKKFYDVDISDGPNSISFVEKRLSFDESDSFYEGAVAVLYTIMMAHMYYTEKTDDLGSILLHISNLETNLFKSISEYVLKNRKEEKYE